MADSRIERVTTPIYLTQFSVGFEMRELKADIAAPRMTVGQKAGKYRIYGKNLGVPRQANRAPGTLPNEVEDRYSSGTFYAEMYALRTKVYDEERANNPAANLGGVDLDVRATAIVTEALMVARELRVAALFTNPANYPGSNVIAKAGGSEWDTILTSAPQTVRADLDSLVTKAMQTAQVARLQVSLMIPEPVFDQAIRYNTTLLNSIVYSQLGVMTEDLLRSLLGVKQVILTTAQYNGNLSGIETSSGDPITGYVGSYIWGDTVWAGVLSEGSTQLRPTFAQTFDFAAETGGQIRQVRRYRHADEGARADWIEAAESVDEKVTYTGGGAILTNALSTI